MIEIDDNHVQVILKRNPWNDITHNFKCSYVFNKNEDYPYYNRIIDMNILSTELPTAANSAADKLQEIVDSLNRIIVKLRNVPKQEEDVG